MKYHNEYMATPHHMMFMVKQFSWSCCKVQVKVHININHNMDAEMSPI